MTSPKTIRASSTDVRSAFAQWLGVEFRAGVKLVVLEGLTSSGKTTLTKEPFILDGLASTNIEVDSFLPPTLQNDATPYLAAIDQSAMLVEIERSLRRLHRHRAGKLLRSTSSGDHTAAKRGNSKEDESLMPGSKRLGLDSPTDLLAKLNWEILQLGHTTENETVASYRAFNCAVTAWTITDWVWNSAPDDLRERFKRESRKPKARNGEPLASLLRQQCRELAICQQLANGSKHFILDDYNDENISSYRSPSITLYLTDKGESRSAPNYSVFVNDGTRAYSDVGLFSRARDHWIAFFERYGVQ